MTAQLRLPRRLASALRARAAAVRAAADRGSGQVVGWAVGFPLAIALFFTVVQTVFWYQARSMCQAAAHAGTQAAKAYNAPAGAGSRAATSYLASVADDSVNHVHTGESMTATSVTVTCHAHAKTLPLPWPSGLTTVDQSSTAARERFTTPGTP
jgi:hypothetical protein